MDNPLSQAAAPKRDEIISKVREQAAERLRIKQRSAIEALRNQENGAEYGILYLLSEIVYGGGEILPEFQLMANVVIAKSVACNCLPYKKLGRPSGSDEKGIDLTRKYFDMRDSGVGRSDAIMHIEHEFGYDERHISRIIKKYKTLVGDTIEERDGYRRRQENWKRLFSLIHDGMNVAENAAYLEEQEKRMAKLEAMMNPTDEEVAAFVEKSIQDALATVPPTDRK